MISLVILSGRSGSGKSTALHVLEDLGYYCIDNLPASLLSPLIARLSDTQGVDKVSVSIDARNIAADLEKFSDTLELLSNDNVTVKIIYLDSASPTLVKRFSETRRKHPLTNHERDLREALELETELLEPILAQADLTIDTTDLTIHELRDLVRDRVGSDSGGLALLFQSFAFKSGVPVDADLVFDVRCLPNPHWVPALRAQTGLDEDVKAWLGDSEEVTDMTKDIEHFLTRWLPSFQQNNRSYMTVAIGCTGGQHRSVYLCETLYNSFKSRWPNLQVRHRELYKLGKQNQLSLKQPEPKD